MPADAKCGLLVGVGVVLAVAVLFFQKDPAPTPAPTIQAQTKSRAPAAAVQPPAREPDSTRFPGRVVSRTDDTP